MASSQKSFLEYLVLRGKILCFGDSLTHGMLVLPNGDWHQVHPYSIQLSKRFNQTVVREEGISGERVDHMVSRLPALLHQFNPDISIILGGTNDLAGGRNAEEITQDLMTLHKSALGFKSDEISDSNHLKYTIAMTVPPAGWNNEIIESNREKLNNELRSFQSRHANRIMLLDLAKGQPFNLSSKIDPHWSVDGTHYSAQGYDLIGERLFQLISQHDFNSKS